MVTAHTPEGIYMKLSPDLTPRNIDFELADYIGNVVSLRGRPLSFELCFDHSLNGKTPLELIPVGAPFPVDTGQPSKRGRARPPGAKNK